MSRLRGMCVSAATALLLMSLASASVISRDHKAYDGRVCALGDFNGDRMTDVLVQQKAGLRVLLQVDEFASLAHMLDGGPFTNGTLIRVNQRWLDQGLECSLGDFNGDSALDILVASYNVGEKSFETSIFLSDKTGTNFTEYRIGEFGHQPMAIDVNGDGRHDVLGFHTGNNSFHCLLGWDFETENDDRFEAGALNMHSCSEYFNGDEFEPFSNMPHLFVDINGDLSAELVFMTKKNGRLELQAWKRVSFVKWEPQEGMIPPLPANMVEFGAAVAADFDGDMEIEIGLPVCTDDSCQHVTHFVTYQHGRGWTTSVIDLQDLTIKKDPWSRVVFRVGDFTLDGFPDLVATMMGGAGKKAYSKIIDNVPCDNCNVTTSRKFQLRRTPELIQPAEVALGQVLMSSYFDLKEDGSLDIMVEFIASDNTTKIDFITCDDKGDTTFLKVQIFTAVCDGHCQGKEVGSGISWGGSCVAFRMNDAWGGSRQSAACQLPATTHRSLMAPYVLFGLGRSPNFIDMVTLGSPMYPGAGKEVQHHNLRQIVPNSRIMVVPPMGNGTWWQSRLYITPSQLIIQSLLVLASVCILLLLVAMCLHYREKKEDRVERQAQSHRFHFDAM